MEKESGAGEERIHWIDCAKGIAILMVIVGHGVDGILRAMIFSFHMPLFFILSGRTSGFSKDRREWLGKTKKAGIHLLIPGVIMYLLRVAAAIWQEPGLVCTFSYWKKVLFTFLFASGVDVENSGIFGSVYAEAMGIPWFFFALFFGKILYDYLHVLCRFKGYGFKGLALVCMMASAAGVVLGKIWWLPFSMDIALAVVPFFYLGDRLKGFAPERGSWKLMMVFGAVWLATLALEYPDLNRWTYMELAWRRYPLYPLCFVTAAAGSLFWCEVSIFLMRLGNVIRPLVFLGRNSLYMLCVHIMDYLWQPLCYRGGSALVSLILKICVDFIVFFLLMLMRKRFRRAGS